jgi:hypothetical protein
MNSRESASCCHSTRWRSHLNVSSSLVSLSLPSLYFQCAAMPSSAMRCISSVRICTSNGCPSSPTTEVCKD